MKNILTIITALMLCSFTETKVCYVKVSQDFKDNYEYYKKGVNVLKTATDTSGNIVVSCNAMNEFPELFDTMGIEIIWLSPNAFPLDTTNYE